ncbi:MFS transporter [Sporomusa aerivorans]|uniref:MFS transporter n=1 Tax=Sporomusa aerivorans TaxID=204936 RepID=UPI00352A0E6A
MATPAVIARKTSVTRALLAGLIGNILEWFDYALYGFFATAISINFFPAQDALVSLMLSFMVFGLGFCARPLGGFIFGHYADKLGRKNILAATVILMGCSTFIMGVLPGYAQIGLAAPLILTAMRLVQGVAAGGEWGSCVSFLAEYAKPHNRAFIVSFSQVGSAIGLLLGALVGTVLSSWLTQDEVYAWGWRLAFGLGIFVAIIGYYIRKSVEETPLFQEHIETAGTNKPIKEAFQGYKKQMVTVFLLMSGANVTYWLVLNFMSTYISRFLKLSLTTGFTLTIITLMAYMIGLPISGYLADRFGRKPLMLIGSAGIVIGGYPLFMLLAKAGSYGEMASIVFALAFIFALFQGSNTVALSELFPTSVRCSGFSIAYQLSSAIFAGTAMAAVTWLINVTGSVMAVPLYMCGVMVITLLAVIFLYRETKDQPFA